jgi:hypothetical protein
MNCPSAYRHDIHRVTLSSITHTIKTRCDSGIRTHLGKIKAHSHSLGNDLADILANHAADGHPPDSTYTTGSDVSIGHWTWPYTLIPQTLGEPIPYRYTNLRTDAHTYNTKHTQTHTHLTHHQTRCPPSPRSGGRRRLHVPQKTHIPHQHPIHSQAQNHVGRPQHSPPHPQPHPALSHVRPIHHQGPHSR